MIILSPNLVTFCFSGKRIKRSVELDKFNNVEADYITLSYDDLADLINYANEQLEKRTEKSPSLDHRPQYQHTRVKRESQGIDLSIADLHPLIYLF